MSSEERGVVKGVGVKFPQSEVIGGVEWLEMAPRISMSAFELYDRYAPGRRLRVTESVLQPSTHSRIMCTLDGAG